VEQGQRETARNEATHDRLREREDPARQAQSCTSAGKEHGRAHGTEKESPGQADDLERQITRHLPRPRFQAVLVRHGVFAAVSGCVPVELCDSVQTCLFDLHFEFHRDGGRAISPRRCRVRSRGTRSTHSSCVKSGTIIRVMDKHGVHQRIDRLPRMPPAVAATLVAGFVVLACSSSGLKNGAGDGGAASGGHAGSSMSGGVAAGFGGTIGSGGVNGGHPSCGNGVLEPPEKCDDGNRGNGDGCSSLCEIELNYICPSPGQPCFDTAVCGDGIVTPDESCDDGNTVSSDGCSGDCQRIDPGWQCPISGRPCSQICSFGPLDGSVPCSDANDLVERCGDGIVTAGEGCDCGDGTVAVPAGCLGPNGDNTYGGCTTKCTWGHRCGDGHVDMNFNELCDLGNLNGACLDYQSGIPQDAGEGSPGDAGCPLGSFDWDGTPVCNCPAGTMVLCTTACQYPLFL